MRALRARFSYPIIAICLMAGGCHGAVTPYKTAMNDAEEARREGDFAAERAHFEEAAKLAKKDEDASEAHYRRAQSWVREGQLEKGALELESFAKKNPTSPRAARAWLDAGRAWEKQEENTKALSAYDKVVARYAESGVALPAAKRIADLRSEAPSEQARANEWRHLLEKNSSPVLDEGLRYNYARSLEADSPRQAILTYEDVARRHPLPRGTYADEALLRAAKLRRQELDYQGSLATLELLLEQGGPAAIVGSYVRTAYVEALMLKGRILRDNMNEPERAREVFRLLGVKHPQSRLVDDALWENLRTVQQQGGNACEAFAELKKASPSSKFVRCEGTICGSLPPAGECALWLAGIE